MTTRQSVHMQLIHLFIAILRTLEFSTARASWPSATERPFALYSLLLVSDVRFKPPIVSLPIVVTGAVVAALAMGRTNGVPFVSYLGGPPRMVCYCLSKNGLHQSKRLRMSRRWQLNRKVLHQEGPNKGAAAWQGGRSRSHKGTVSIFEGLSRGSTLLMGRYALPEFPSTPSFAFLLPIKMAGTAHVPVSVCAAVPSQPSNAVGAIMLGQHDYCQPPYDFSSVFPLSL